MVFLDDGNSITISARATGMDANETYLTQMFDVGSVATGANACQPTIFDPDDPDYLIDIQFLGFYEDGEFSITLSGDDYVSVDRIGTVSLERVISLDPLATEHLACASVIFRPALQ